MNNSGQVVWVGLCRACVCAVSIPWLRLNSPSPYAWNDSQITATNIATGAMTAYCRQLYFRYHRKLDVGSQRGRQFSGTTHGMGYTIRTQQYIGVQSTYEPNRTVDMTEARGQSVHCLRGPPCTSSIPPLPRGRPGTL